MLAIDHVIVLVEDLDAAARRYDEHNGLASVPGGRHPGHGTANRIVPLGGSYLELMAVVDRVEAESSPLGRGVRRRLGERGESPAAPVPAHRSHRGRGPTDRRPAAPLDWVELGGDKDRLARWLGQHELPLRHVEGAPGPHRLAVGIANGEPIAIG